MGSEGSRFTVGRGGSNCPEYPSRTKQDVRLRSGTTATTWAGQVVHPVHIIQVEQSSFRAAHYDLFDDKNSFLCMTKRRKLWLLTPPGNLGGQMARFCGDNDSQRGFSDAVRFLRNLGSRQKKLVFYTVLDESKTLYLPYGWVHSVITLCERDEGGSFVCSMWYLELPTDGDRVAAFKRKALYNARAGERTSSALAALK